MSEMAVPAAVRDVLDISLREHAQVTVHLRSERVEGFVTRLDDEVVELRLPSGRCVVRLDRIDAVTRE
jgi:hypothetical protein